MQEPISRYFKVGLIHFMAYPTVTKGDGPVLETLREILADEYFTAVEVTHIADDAVRAKAGELISQSHVTPCYGAQPRLLGSGLNPNHLDEEERLKAQRLLTDCIDEAHQLGCCGMAFLAGKWAPEKLEEHYSQLLKTTRHLCSHAMEKGLSVELEVFDYDVDKAALIGPASLALRFAEDMRKTSPNFGLLVDLSHFPLTRECSRHVIGALYPYITHLHIGNAVVTPGEPGYGDLHPRFGFPNGSNDVPQVLEFLRAVKDTGLMNAAEPLVLSFEVKPFGDEESALVVANAKRVLNRAWSLLE